MVGLIMLPLCSFYLVITNHETYTLLLLFNEIVKAQMLILTDRLFDLVCRHVYLGRCLSYKDIKDACYICYSKYCLVNSFCCHKVLREWFSVEYVPVKPQRLHCCYCCYASSFSLRHWEHPLLNWVVNDIAMSSFLYLFCLNIYGSCLFRAQKVVRHGRSLASLQVHRKLFSRINFLDGKLCFWKN